MADIIKVLGQIAAAATTSEVLYTVPSYTQTTCSSLVVCNRTASPLTFRLSVHVNDAGDDDMQYLYYDKSVDGNESFAIVLGLTLGENDVVKTYASDTGLSFNLFGVETS